MSAANTNIPEAVRAVAADGTQLRYTLMEMAGAMDDIISLGRGDPDLPTPPHIIEAANRAMHEQRTGLTRYKASHNYAAPSRNTCGWKMVCRSGRKT